MTLAVYPEKELPPGWKRGRPCFSWRITNGTVITILSGFADEHVAMASGARAMFKIACGEELTQEDARWRP